MTFFELATVCLLILFGLICGRIGFVAGGLMYGVISFVFGTIFAISAVYILDKISFFFHERKRKEIINCKCGSCCFNDYEWVGSDVSGNLIARYKCGKMYVLKGETLEELPESETPRAVQ